VDRKIVVSVSGKGGTGKSTIAALMVKHLSEAGGKSVLAVDADPASNLADLLGVKVDRTVGEVTEELRRMIDKGALPPGYNKKDLLEYKVYSVLKETPKFDLLVMGRGEGEGCYCYVNAVLSSILDTLTRNYDVTIMDMEAGLEHISRRTDRDVDIMMVVVDPSKMSFATAKRIKEVAKEAHVEFKRILMVGNKFKPGQEAMLKSKAEEVGIEYIGYVPEDGAVHAYNLEGKPLLELPSNSPAVVAVKDIMIKIGLL